MTNPPPFKSIDELLNSLEYMNIDFDDDKPYPYIEEDTVYLPLSGRYLGDPTQNLMVLYKVDSFYRKDVEQYLDERFRGD